MKPLITLSAATVLACAALVALPTAPATAAAATSSVNLFTGDADTLRAQLYATYRSAGPTITVWGSNHCTTATSIPDARWSRMPSGWNDVVSAAYDYASCDINLSRDTGNGDPMSGYRNYGDLGRHVGELWDNKTSSFMIS